MDQAEGITAYHVLALIHNDIFRSSITAPFALTSWMRRALFVEAPTIPDAIFDAQKTKRARRVLHRALLPVGLDLL